MENIKAILNLFMEVTAFLCIYFSCFLELLFHQVSLLTPLQEYEN